MRLPSSSTFHAGLIAVVIWAGLPVTQAATLPAPVANDDYSLLRVGSGKLAWLGQPIYEASLWTVDGQFKGYAPGSPVALSLWYGRAFSRDQLLRITNTAWRRLDAGTPEQRKVWLAALEKVWLDVAAGDNQTAVVVPGKSIRFYDQRGLLGQIDDPELGPAFLSIWLDSRSVVADLRVKLLNVP